MIVESMKLLSRYFSAHSTLFDRAVQAQVPYYITLLGHRKKFTGSQLIEVEKGVPFLHVHIRDHANAVGGPHMTSARSTFIRYRGMTDSKCQSHQVNASMWYPVLTPRTCKCAPCLCCYAAFFP